METTRPEATWDDYGLVLLFDGRCGICTRTARWVRERDTRGSILVVPNQSLEWRSRFSIRPEDAERRVYAIDADGRVYAGAAAVNRVLEELGGRYARAGRLYRLSPVRLMEDAVYPVIARYRGLLSRWGDRPACDEPDARCA